MIKNVVLTALFIVMLNYSFSMDYASLFMQGLDEGNLDMVQAALMVVPAIDINAVLPNGLTPLHFVSRHNFTAIVELLLKFKANANSVDGYGLSPLFDAVFNGSNSITKLLLAAHANTQVAIYGRASPLHVAAGKNLHIITQLLIDVHANLDCTDNKGSTPLHIAVFHGHDAVVRTLLNASARTNIVDNQDCTALDIAALKGNCKIVEMLLDKGAYIDNQMHPYCFALINKAQSNRAQLMCAIRHNSIERVRHLLRDNIYANEAAQLMLARFYKLLLEAVNAGNLEKIIMLSNRGLSLAIRQGNGDTFLHRAISANKTHVVKYFLCIGMDPTHTNNKGQTAVHLAADKTECLLVMFEFIKENSV
jgi:ankyrin repeat protein